MILTKRRNAHGNIDKSSMGHITHLSRNIIKLRFDTLLPQTLNSQMFFNERVTISKIYKRGSDAYSLYYYCVHLRNMNSPERGEWVQYISA